MVLACFRWFYVVLDGFNCFRCLYRLSSFLTLVSTVKVDVVDPVKDSFTFCALKHVCKKAAQNPLKNI